MNEKDLTFIKNAVMYHQCYNCALRRECEREHPRSFEPIGSCDKWTEERKGGVTLGKNGYEVNRSPNIYLIKED